MLINCSNIQVTALCLYLLNFKHKSKFDFYIGFAKEEQEENILLSIQDININLSNKYSKQNFFKDIRGLVSCKNKSVRTQPLRCIRGVSWRLQHKDFGQIKPDPVALSAAGFRINLELLRRLISVYWGTLICVWICILLDDRLRTSAL